MNQSSLRNIRGTISAAYDGALTDGISESTKECFRDVLRNVSDVHTQSMSQSSVIGTCDPIFHASLQIIENPNLIPTETIRQSFAEISKDSIIGTKCQMNFLRPIRGVSVKARLFLGIWQKKVDSLFQTIQNNCGETSGQIPLDDFAGKGQLKSSEAMKTSSDDEFDWQDGCECAKGHDAATDDKLICAFLDYNADAGQIRALLAYLRRVHAIYWRYKLLCSAYPAEVSRSPACHLPRLPQVIAILVRTPFLNAATSKLSCARQARLASDSFVGKDVRKSRGRVFESPQTSSAPSGSHQRLSPFLEALQPCFAPRSSDLRPLTTNEATGCRCSICQTVDKARPSKRPLVLQFRHETFVKSFIGRWVFLLGCSQDILLPSFEAYFDLHFFVQAKSEGLLLFQEMFFGLVMKHWSKFSVQSSPQSGDLAGPSTKCPFVQFHNRLIGQLQVIEADFVTIGRLYVLLLGKIYRATRKVKPPAVAERTACGICHEAPGGCDGAASYGTEDCDLTVLDDDELTRGIRWSIDCHSRTTPSYADSFLADGLKGTAITAGGIASDCDKLLHSLWCNEYAACDCAFPEEFILRP